MRILLTGANGLLGSSLLHNISLAKTYEVLPTSYNLSGNAKVKMDISSNEDVVKVFEDFKTSCSHKCRSDDKCRFV